MDRTEQYRLNQGCEQLEDLLSRLEHVLRQMESNTIPTTLLTPVAKHVPEQVQPLLADNPTQPKNHVAHTLACYCFGRFRVFQDDRMIQGWNGHKGQLILKYLITHAGKPVAKETLMEALWPETDPDAARRNLHQAIYSVRHTLKAHDATFQHILFRHESYLLNPSIHLWIDFVEFEKQIQCGRVWESKHNTMAAMETYACAEALFQGHFLQDEPHEEWVERKRLQLQNLYLEIADKLSHHYVAEQQFRAAILQCQRILTVDHCHEPAHQVLMQCYWQQGQRHLAVMQYQTCVQALRDTLGLSPSDATRQIYQQLLRPPASRPVLNVA